MTWMNERPFTADRGPKTCNSLGPIAQILGQESEDPALIFVWLEGV
jgi:hypothetical protein